MAIEMERGILITSHDPDTKKAPAAAEGDVVATIVAVASGGPDGEALAAWIRRSNRPSPSGTTRS